MLCMYTCEWIYVHTCLRASMSAESSMNPVSVSVSSSSFSAFSGRTISKSFLGTGSDIRPCFSCCRLSLCCVWRRKITVSLQLIHTYYLLINILYYLPFLRYNINIFLFKLNDFIMQVWLHLLLSTILLEVGLSCVYTVLHVYHGCIFTMCLAYAGSVSCSSLLIFSLSRRGVRPGVKPGVAAPRGVIPPPAWGVMPSDPWPGPGVLLEMTWPLKSTRTVVYWVII